MQKRFTLGLVLVAGAAGLVVLSACTHSSTAPVPAAPPASQSEATTDKAQDDQSAEYLKAQAEAEEKARADRIKFTAEDIYFKNGSYALDAAAQEVLRRKAEWLRNNPTVVVFIEGHTDEPGSKEYNFALGDRRAGAVKTFFLNEGITTERLIAVSYGKERPLTASGSEAERAKNRRVHVVVE